jgi:hypothetical protein
MHRREIHRSTEYFNPSRAWYKSVSDAWRNFRGNCRDTCCLVRQNIFRNATQGTHLTQAGNSFQVSEFGQKMKTFQKDSCSPPVDLT